MKKQWSRIVGSILILLVAFTATACNGAMTSTNENDESWQEHEGTQLDNDAFIPDENGEAYPYRTHAMKVGTKSPEQRLTLDMIKQIVFENKDFDVIREKFDKIQPYPDCIGGSGITHIEYWMSSDECDKVTILKEQGQVFHTVTNEEGVPIRYEVFFDVRMNELNPEYEPKVPEKYQDTFQRYGTEHTYPYREYAKQGETEAPERRLTLDLAKQIISEYEGFEVICEELGKIQPYPDHEWIMYNDISCTEYWMNYDEHEQIVIVPHLGCIYHVIYSEIGEAISFEMIYGRDVLSSIEQ